MFTGLIEAIGTVKKAEKRSGSLRLTIAVPFAGELQVDQSIAINGACQTVVATHRDWFSVVAIPETLERTTLAELKPNHRVHIERAMKADGRLDGHIVQGHVDGVVTVVRVERRGDSREVYFRIPEEYKRFIVEKGSVTLAGISLTVSKLRGNEFAVALIPHTLEQTLADDWMTGTKVNLEVDILAKYIDRLLKDRA